MPFLLLFAGKKDEPSVLTLEPWLVYQGVSSGGGGTYGQSG